MRNRIILAGIAVSLSPVMAQAHAQAVAGRVVTVGTALPRAGVAVLLIDDHDRVVGRSHSDSVDASFVVAAPAAGSYHIAMFDERGGSFMIPNFRLSTGDTSKAVYSVPEAEESFPGIRRAGDVDEPAKLLPGRTGIRAPISVTHGGRGFTTVMFVVDSAGRAEIDGLVAVLHTGAPFVAATRDALKRGKFTPARLGSIPVSQVVFLTATFGQGGDTLSGDMVVSMGATRPIIVPAH